MVNRVTDCFAIKLNPRCVYLLVPRQKKQEWHLAEHEHLPEDEDLSILGRLCQVH